MSGESEHKDRNMRKVDKLWSVLLFLWIIIWALGVPLVCTNFDCGASASLIIIGFPLIASAFLIPFLILYSKSRISFNWIISYIYKYDLVRPRAITVLCYLYIPTSAMAVLFTLLIPNLFEQHGTEIGATYSYVSAMIFFIHLVSMICYWYMKKLGVYLYSFIFIVSSIVNYWYFNLPIRFVSVLWNVVIIFLGTKYILIKRKRRETS